MCALFVFGHNALEMRKFGMEFHTRPSKWRQITFVMGQGVHVCMCLYVFVHVCACLYICLYLCIYICGVCVCMPVYCICA